MFWGRTDAYNIEHGYTEQEKKLDRRRMSDAYHRFCIVMFNVRQFKDRNFIIKNDIDKEIEENISKYDSAFTHYAKCHNCSEKGCGTCIVLDGHLKAHRKICKKSDCKNDPKRVCFFAPII